MGKKEKNVEIQCMSTGDLPESWVISTLGEISTKPQYGWTTKANHESGEVKLLRTTDITSGKIDWITVPYCTKEPDDLKKYLLKAGDIVISRAGSVGVSYLLTDTDNAVFASYLIRFRPNEPVDKKYVYYYLKSPDYWKAIGKSTLGIAVPNVNATKLAKIKIPIAPENEQKRIVAEIEKQFSRLDEAVENLKRVKVNLKRYKASVLKAAVEGKLTGTQKKEWNTKKIARLIKFSQGVQVPKPKQIEIKKEGYVRFLRIIDFTQRKEPSRYIENPGKKGLVEKEDLSMVRYGATTGFICRGLEGAIANNLFRIIPNDELINDFLFYFFKSPLFKEILNQRLKGAAMPAISFGLLNDIDLHYPSVNEQKLIVKEVESRLSVTDNIEKEMETNLKKTGVLRQSILKKAFEGKLVSENKSQDN